MYARFNSRHDKSSSEFKLTVVYFSNMWHVGLVSLLEIGVMCHCTASTPIWTGAGGEMKETTDMRSKVMATYSKDAGLL